THPRAPGLFATNALAPLVDAEIAPAVPVFGPADVAHHGTQGGANVGLFGKVPRDRVLERDEARFAALLGDVAPDAAIAKELARRPEHRLAADREEALLAIGVDAPDLEIAERPSPVEVGAVRRPAGGVGMDRGDFPARLADDRLARRSVFVGVRRASDAVLGVGLPVEIRRQLRQAAKARFALAHHTFGLLAAQQLPELAADHAHRLQQPRIGFTRSRRSERNDADRHAFGDHRPQE